jgi:hypothetical protein
MNILRYIPRLHVINEYSAPLGAEKYKKIEECFLFSYSANMSMLSS